MPDNTTEDLNDSEISTPTNQVVTTIDVKELEALRQKAKSHDKNAVLARKALDELDQVKSLRKEEERLKAEAEGDLKKQVEIAHREAQEYKEKLAKNQQLLKQRVIVSDALTVAAKYSSRPEVVIKLIEDQLDIAEDESGTPQAIVKGSTKDLSTYIQEVIKNQLPETSLNSRKAGTGIVASPEGQQTSSDALTIDSIRKLSIEERTKLFAKDPKARKLWVTSGAGVR